MLHKNVIQFYFSFYKSFFINFCEKIIKNEELLSVLKISIFHDESISSYKFVENKTVMGEVIDFISNCQNNISPDAEIILQEIYERFSHKSIQSIISYLNELLHEVETRQEWLSVIIVLCNERTNNILAAIQNECTVNDITMKPSYLTILFIAMKYPNYFKTSEISIIMDGAKKDMVHVDDYYDPSKKRAEFESQVIKTFGHSASSIYLYSDTDQHFESHEIVKILLKENGSENLKTAYENPKGLFFKLKSLKMTSLQEDDTLQIPQRLAWYFMEYCTFLFKELNKIYKNHNELHDQHAKDQHDIKSVNEQIKKLENKNNELANNLKYTEEKFKELNETFSKNINDSVFNKQVTINRMQDTIDTQVLRISELENLLLKNAIEKEKIYILDESKNDLEQLIPDISNKTVLFLGGRNSKFELCNMFSKTSVLHYSPDELSSLKHIPKVDEVVFFTDVNSHAMFYYIKPYFDNILYINNSSKSTLKRIFKDSYTLKDL